MPVNTPQISVDPYRSEVPLVQIPQQDLQPPQTQGSMGYVGKGMGAAGMGDALLKGILKGLQRKEEQKYKTAEATMNAQDAEVAAKKKRYEDLWTTKGDSPDTKIAHEDYANTVNKYAAMRRQYMAPKKETGTKKEKKEKGAEDKKEGYRVLGGLGDHVKQFLARNPTLLPDAAITAWQAQVTPYGQVTLELAQQKQQYDAAQRIEADQKVSFAAKQTIQGYGGKSRAELQAAPPTLGGKAAGFKNALEEYNNALAVMNPPKPVPASKVGTTGAYYDKKAQELGKDVSELTSEELLEAKSEFQEAGRAESQANLYYDAAAREWGTTRDKLTTQQLEYVDAMRARSQAQAKGRTSYSYRTTDANGNSTTVTKKVSESIPTPQGVKAIPEKVFSDGQEDAGSHQGASSSPKAGGTRFNQVPRSLGAGRGNLAAGFPTQGGGVTPMRTKSDLALEKAVSDEYGKADTHFNEELDKIDQAAHQANNPISPAEVKTRTDRVTQAYNDEKARITRARVSQIEAAGGDPWKRRAKDDKGNEIGTMDDVSWKNTRTGYDVPAPSGGPQAQPSPQAQAPVQQAGGKPQQMTPAPQQGSTPPQPEAGNPPATPPKPRTIEQLRDERNKKKVLGGLYRYSGAEGMVDYYRAIGRGISNVVGFDKKVVGAAGHVLSTFLNGGPGDVNDYEINGSPVKTTAKDAQEFHDSGFTVREKYNVNGVDHFLTPEEAKQARKAGYKITSSKKHQGPA